METEILSSDLPALKIVSASPHAAEGEINRLLKDYTPFQYWLNVVGDQLELTCLLVSKSEMRKMQLANIRGAGPRQ